MYVKPEPSRHHPRPGSFKAALVTLIVSLAAPVAPACTDFIMPPPSETPELDSKGEIKNSVVSARTMDFDVNLAWFMETQNDGIVVNSSDPDRSRDKRGRSWITKYKMVGFRGAEAFSKPGLYFDGMNSEGLSAAMLWLDAAWESDRRNYQQPVKGDNNLSVQSVVNFVLSQCQNVSCAVQLLSPENNSPKIWGEKLTISEEVELSAPLALHLVLHDANNETAVIEWYKGEQHIFWKTPNNLDSPRRIRVLTNDPVYLDQVRALRETRFNSLNSNNRFKLPINKDETLPEHFFLPGDSSSGSRFIRANKLNTTQGEKRQMGLYPRYYPAGEAYWPGYPLSNLLETPFHPRLWRVEQANRIMARLEEVWGEYPEVFGTRGEITLNTFFYTNFTVIRDHTNRNLYLRGVYNSTLRRVSLKPLFARRIQNYLKQYIDQNPESEDYSLPQYHDVSNQFRRELPEP